MELKVYDGEQFERGATWYLVFALIILLTITISILSKNIFGGVLVLVIAGGYVYYLTKTEDTIDMVIGKNALQVNKKVYPWDKLAGFVLEYHTEKKKIHNIVIIDTNKEVRIYTINDSEKNLQNFVNELNGYIPMLDNYDQGFFDKVLRKIKL